MAHKEMTREFDENPTNTCLSGIEWVFEPGAFPSFFETIIHNLKGTMNSVP